MSKGELLRQKERELDAVNASIHNFSREYSQCEQQCEWAKTDLHLLKKQRNDLSWEIAELSGRTKSARFVYVNGKPVMIE